MKRQSVRWLTGSLPRSDAHTISEQGNRFSRLACMHTVRFLPLEFTKSQVKVSWTVDPRTPIYDRTAFTLDFGEALDVESLPVRLWWTVVLLTLHAHWNLLRPCRVVLPITLDENEIEFWLRLLDQECVSLERYRGTSDFARTIEIECDGKRLKDWALTEASDRWATAFSGGRDSLAQTGLLCELTSRPLLVNTCSPMPPLLDNEGEFRERTMSEIVRRRDVELVVVKSDLRSIWPHYEVPHQLGYKVSMGQIGDPYLVTAMTIAVAASRGIRHVTLATEIENARTNEYDGRLAFFEFNLACALPLIVAMDRLVGRLGMEVSSLIWPFNQYQVQMLLRKRYADIADLQNSCFWMQHVHERSCSRCSKCLKIALMLLAVGEDPASLNVDLVRMFRVPHDYDPSGAHLGGRTAAYSSARMDHARALPFFPKVGLLEKMGLREPRAFREFKKVVAAFAKHTRPAVEATHDEFFRYVPDALRERIRAISLEHWPEVDRVEWVADKRCDSLADRITETL